MQELIPKYNESGLVPAIVQDEASGQVLMLAWMNADAFARTLANREAYFWSRSRQELWHKGATSGNYLHIHEIWLDCDQDTVLMRVHADGPVRFAPAIADGRVIEHDSMEALKNRHRRIVELAPSAEAERFTSVLKAANFPVERLSNGRLRVESATEAVEPILRLMREHNLPPAEIAANPNALHELFLQSLAASKTPQNGNQA